jgi:hypothetical protein
MQWVPGYGGYADPSHRRDRDGDYRRYLADRLSALRPSLDRLIRELAERGKVIDVLPLERARHRLGEAEHLMRTTDYESSAFFQANDLDEAALERLYQYDLVLLEHTRRLKEHVERVEQDPSSPENRASAEEIEATADALVMEFERRTDLIRQWS